MSGEASQRDDLQQQVAAWLEDDPDPVTRTELERLLFRVEQGDDAARAELADRFAGTLQFGTAGLRGAVGAGPNRMNRAVVIRAAAGLAGYLHGQLAAGAATESAKRAGTTPVDGEGRRPLVVVGLDARHRSADFARDTAAVLTGAGCEALLLPRALPTPVLAFAVRHLGCDAGVMVTASHNPPRDNGYKVYLGGDVDHEGAGCQIVPPADADIAAAIAAIGPVRRVPMPEQGWTTLGADVLEAYLAAASAVADPASPRDLDVVCTPLHGVGGDVVAAALVRAGFAAPFLVPEQAAPDPDFPTVAFPNPEEAGVIDLALAAARERGADLVIANDPDADRCAVAVRDPGGPPATGGWRMLHGDELGALLGDHVASRLPAGGMHRANGVLASSIVSGSLLGRIAAAHGLGHTQTLTGFKWIARTPGLVFGYEEALGYCVDPGSVRDKDGISAAVLVCELAASLKAQGRTLLDALDDLARRYGLHGSDQLSVRVDDLTEIADAMQRLRERPPTTLAGAPVTSSEDLSAGVDGLPPTDGLRYRTDAGDRVVVRPSGTEPKLKCYLEVVVEVAGDDVAGARVTAQTRLAALRTEIAAAAGVGSS